MNDQNMFNHEGSNNNPYQAPTTPQPSTNTFDYNQLYGVSSTPVEQPKQEVVFDDSEITNTVVAPVNEPQIKISNDELIPEFDASVLEVVPQEETIVDVPKTETISKMAVGKKAEDEKNKSNLIFILLLFGVIAVAIWFIFPLLVKF